MPISRNPRRMRTAISPRLAIRTLRMRFRGMVAMARVGILAFLGRRKNRAGTKGTAETTGTTGTTGTRKSRDQSFFRVFVVPVVPAVPWVPASNLLARAAPPPPPQSRQQQQPHHRPQDRPVEGPAVHEQPHPGGAGGDLDADPVGVGGADLGGTAVDRRLEEEVRALD